MATCGHMLSMVGAVFFFAAVLESCFENCVFTSPNLGLPRWQKRIHYYLFKLKFNRSVDQMFRSIPNADARQRLIEGMFNEYEIYRRG